MVFGAERRKEEHEYYIGKWVIIYNPGINNFGGLVQRIEGSHAVLNPLQGGRYDAEKGPAMQLIDEEAKVPLNDNSVIEPTTRESLENFCLYQNKKTEEREKKKKEEPSETPNQKV